MHTIKE